ncbi:MAG TPA: hypothetical protein H9867_05050 [Candidatus Corynebacterium gallistercoris]|uniref:DUF6802 domain-containing protein n=1 Tax=Candidatus Corynebacterium gallistercoris TaxID=2838530 RepID=A0A9D1UR19_9CORY|nr:hypothetical protein [Candidatus Corynebacterium gallistercoris]
MPVEHFFFDDGPATLDTPLAADSLGADEAWLDSGHQGFLLEGDLLGTADDPLQRLLAHPAVHGTPADPSSEPSHGGEFTGRDGHYLRVEHHGREYTVGNPAATSPPESVTLADDTSMSILSDTDGDGKVDYVSSVQFNGRWSAWRWVGDGEGRGGVAPKNNNHPTTPENGQQEWETGTWKCVERGEWG